MHPICRKQLCRTYMLHSAVWTSMLHSTVWTSMLHSAVWTSMLHSTVWTSMLHIGVWTSMQCSLRMSQISGVIPTLSIVFCLSDERQSDWWPSMSLLLTHWKTIRLILFLIPLTGSCNPCSCQLEIIQLPQLPFTLSLIYNTIRQLGETTQDTSHFFRDDIQSNHTGKFINSQLQNSMRTGILFLSELIKKLQLFLKLSQRSFNTFKQVGPWYLRKL